MQPATTMNPTHRLPPLRWTRLPARRLAEDAALQAHWDRLNAARLDLPFLSARAVLAALDCLGSGREQLAIGRLGESVEAMFLLQPEGALRWRTFQPSQMPLGAWVAAPAWPLQALGSALMRDGLPACLVLSLTQIDPLASPRAPDDARQRHDDYIATAWIDVEGSFADYWEARGKNLRQNMRKQRNKLAADGVRTQMRVLREVADMAPALARYGVLECSGWKAEQGTAIHPDNEQGRFYRRLLEEAAAAGEARVYEYLFDEQTVAMNLCLLRAGQLIVLKTGYDAGIKSLSPAFMLREEELQSFFAEGQIRRIEYYGKVMDWHTKLTGNSRLLHHLTLYRWGWLKRLKRLKRPAALKAGAPAPAAAAAAGAQESPAGAAAA
ncbi:MAG: GNAT family N-acetyltransferase [Burkholderiaceae bacterium]